MSKLQRELRKHARQLRTFGAHTLADVLVARAAMYQQRGRAISAAKRGAKK